MCPIKRQLWNFKRLGIKIRPRIYCKGKFFLASLSVEPKEVTYWRKYKTKIWLRHKGNDRVKEQKRDENDGRAFFQALMGNRK